MQTRRLAVAALCALAMGGAQAGQYVLQASKWGASQANAVARAGGTVTYSNGDAGIAVVQSDNPNFLATALSGGAIQSGAADIFAQFTEPARVADVQQQAVSTASAGLYSLQWAPRAIEAPAAWAAGYTGAGVRVAVIDGGIYAAHPDLAGAIDVAASRSFVVGGAPGLNGCSAATFNCDTGTFWHGTHVAGIIAARGAAGTMGIAPGATLIGVKALHNGTGSFGAIISALLYAATDARADIINMSLGAEFNRNEEGAAELRSALNRAVNSATSHGSLVVVAAGNSGIDFGHAGNLTVVPAESGNAIAISATGPVGFALGATNFDAPAVYSNYGNSLVWVAAPGGNEALPGDDPCTMSSGFGDQTLPCWAFDLVLSTSRAGWTWADGTSMAAPAASAVAALIKQNNPGAKPAQLKNGLAQSAVDSGKKGHDEFYGRGFINARRAVGL
jgi:subtilisin family serine protease